MSSSRSYPDHPFLGVSALIRHQAHIVLIERGKEPHLGVWSLPGGVVETGEHLEEAIFREVREEVGLDFIPDSLSELVEILHYDSDNQCELHFVIGVFICDLSIQTESPPQLSAGDDAKDARWVAIDTLDQYTLTDGTKDVIQRLLSNAQSPIRIG
ncbi:NUDIX hydrolase [Cohaesibacter celericrescens]|uniref:NUDIX hydrolase n=1 Tax=Cohaesibacter celericrescens TaxID=2067669 RepID=UPI0035671426